MTEEIESRQEQLEGLLIRAWMLVNAVSTSGRSDKWIREKESLGIDACLPEITPYDPELCDVAIVEAASRLGFDELQLTTRPTHGTH